jgi:hypothetical protein
VTPSGADALPRAAKVLASDTAAHPRARRRAAAETQELAPLVGLTDAGASKQLRQLAAAGLLSTKREGHNVVYSLEPEKLSTLSAELDYVVSGGRSAS